MSDTLGTRFARAIAERDTDGLRALLAPEVDFKGLTPGRLWEGGSADEVLETVFGAWFEESDRVVEVRSITDEQPVGDTALVRYRFDLENPDGAYVAEQQAYYRGEDRIEHLRVMCSGFRPR